MEKGIVEFIDDEDLNKVAVYIYDDFSNDINISTSPEVMDYSDAKKSYKIIGTMINGEIEMFEDEDDDNDEDMYSDEDEDEE